MPRGPTDPACPGEVNCKAGCNDSSDPEGEVERFVVGNVVDDRHDFIDHQQRPQHDDSDK